MNSNADGGATRGSGMPKFQKKFVFALCGLVVVVVTLFAALAERGLRERAVGEIERSLFERADLTRILLGVVPLEPRFSEELDRLADRAGHVANARVTLIASDGRVLGDSEVPFRDLYEVENHADRAEIAQALQAGRGRNSRWSATVGRDLLYVAIRSGTGPEAGVVRLAVDLASVDAAAWKLRQVVFVAAGLGLLVAVLLSVLLARLSVRRIEELHGVVAGISEGQLDRRFDWWSRDELDAIGVAINRVAEQMRARLDKATRESEQLHAVLGSMVDGVLVLDEAGHVTLANPRLRELLDLSGPIEGQPWFELIHNSQAEEALREATATRELVAREFEYSNDSSRALLLHAVGFPADGPRVGTVVVLHDVTEMRRLDRVRSDFIANASHELKTPLTAIGGFADTLAQSELAAEDQDRYIEIIARNARRMSNLVEDLLALSRIESGNARLKRERVDLEEVARMLLDDLAERCEANGIEARLQAAGSTEACADRSAVEQVLTNLLDNALKYTDSPGRIDVVIEAKDDELEVSIQDTGRGIPPEDQARIFERFYRVDTARSRALGGTGLGLSIVKHLVQSMGGVVGLESAPGKGSRFSFTLPHSG